MPGFRINSVLDALKQINHQLYPCSSNNIYLQHLQKIPIERLSLGGLSFALQALVWSLFRSNWRCEVPLLTRVLSSHA